MTVPKKIILSFLLSVFFFASVLAIAYSGFSKIIESRFYNPSVISAVIRETSGDIAVIDDYLSALQLRFASILHENPVFQHKAAGSEPNNDALERSRLFGLLMESVPCLNSVRFADSDGVIHFSTYPPDVIDEGGPLVYRNYREDSSAIPLDALLVPVGEQFRLVFHREGDALIFSFPFADSEDRRIGAALFSVSLGEAVYSLAAAGRMGYNDKLIICPSNYSGGLAGIVKGYPGIPEADIAAEALSAWSGSYQSIVPIPRAGVSLALVSVFSDYGFRYARIVKEDIFTFPKQLSIIMLVSIFFTIFLIVFFAFNLRQKPAGSSGRARPLDANAESLEELESVDAAESKAAAPCEPIVVALDEFRGMIYEQNGIPYVNSDALSRNAGGKLNNDFAELIDSVVANRDGLPPPSPRKKDKPEQAHKRG